MRLRSVLEDLQAWWINTPLHRLGHAYQVGNATVRHSSGYSFVKEGEHELVFIRGENMVAGELRVNDLENSDVPCGLYIVRNNRGTQVRRYKNRKNQWYMEFSLGRASKA